METKYKTHHILEFVLLLICLVVFPAGNLWANEDSKYVSAVREFADNVLKYGRDTYGPKHTPLFVDGLNIHTHEPVKWIAPDGTKWILSNFASQQTLMRTLDGISKITGDPKYRQAAVEAIEYAFANLRSPNGLLYWGQYTAYDAEADDICGTNRVHVFKLEYPYYELMWQVNPDATRQIIEAIWSAHIIDWSNLDMDRGAHFHAVLEEPWNHEYKGGATFFKGKWRGVQAYFHAGSPLAHAGTTLYKLSGEEQPLIWSKRLVKRYVDTRHPKTGISAFLYNNSWIRLGDDLKEHFDDPHTAVFPYNPFEFRSLYYTEDAQAHPWIGVFFVGKMLGKEGKEFTRWALEELTAWGKASYRKKDNSFVPMLTDGTNLEGYTWKNGPGCSSGVNVAKPYPAGPSFFWAYSVAYSTTGDEFMWQMVRDVALGNGLGDIGETPAHTPKLQTDNTCSHAYAVFGFLELYAKTKKPAYLEMARGISDNILLSGFHRGFFVSSKRHLYSRFGCFEPLALLHLDAAMKSLTKSVPQVWPSVSIFADPYRHKEEGVDRRDIYSLTELPEPPLSLQEAAAIGDANLVRTLIEDGTDVDSLDDSFLKTALHRAVISGHKDVAELLLVEGAGVNARDWVCATPLHYAAEKGHNEIAELLTTNGAEVNARRRYPAGDTPLHYAVKAGHKDIVELLIAKGAKVNTKNNDGQTPIDVAISRNRNEIVQLLLAKDATISSIHVAAQMGDLARVKVFLEQGTDINAKDGRGYTPFHYAIWYSKTDIARLLIEKGVDVHSKDQSGYTPLHWAVLMVNKELTELLLAKGADVNAKGKAGETALDFAIYGGKAIGQLLVEKGAEVSSLQSAAFIGDLNKVKTFLDAGVDVNAKNVAGVTALHAAASGGRKEVAEFLIVKGADINASVRNGETPLHWAASKGHKDVAELLISEGADVHAKDKRGRTPLSLAEQRGHKEIVELLKKHGAKE